MKLMAQQEYLLLTGKMMLTFALLFRISLL